MLVFKLYLLILGCSVLAEELIFRKYEDVCYGDLGCFDMGEPWWSLLRPLPPPASPEEINVKLRFFSRPNTQKEYLIDPYPEVIIGKAPFDSNKRTVIITHGFTQNGQHELLHQMKDDYLKRVDANVMIADWGPGASRSNYLQVAANTRVVGRVLARFLKHMIQNRGLNVRNIHLIGHSLGAHVLSYTAKETPGLGRVTALDPAQPAFEWFDKQVRLDASDAEFTDVIHTDAKPFIPFLGFGMVKPHGHVDFYMNGGAFQPGCYDEILPILKNITSIGDLGKISISDLVPSKFCNHVRGVEYFTEALTGNCTFWGKKVLPSSVFLSLANTLISKIGVRMMPPRCNADNCIPMGLETPEYNLRGVFLVKTNSKFPYCLPSN